MNPKSKEESNHLPTVMREGYLKNTVKSKVKRGCNASATETKSGKSWERRQKCLNNLTPLIIVIEETELIRSGVTQDSVRLQARLTSFCKSNIFVISIFNNINRIGYWTHHQQQLSVHNQDY